MSNKSADDYYNRHKDRINEEKRIVYMNDPEFRKRKLAAAQRSRWRRAYGLTKDDYLELLFQQKGRCGICRKTFTKTPCVDHNHKTNEIRGLLCSKCNSALAFLEDDPTIFKWAIEYLEGDGKLPIGRLDKYFQHYTKANRPSESGPSISDAGTT